MSIDLKTLAEQTLIACDASYFTNLATDNARPAGDTNPRHLYVGDTLTPLIDTTPSYAPQFIPTSPSPTNPDPTDGFVVAKEGDALAAGAKFVAFRNESTNSVILAFGGTDGLNATDWKANLFSYGWSEWEALKQQVFTFLDALPRDASGNLTVTVNFTGQSLGGALAQYAAYRWLTEDPLEVAHAAQDKNHITLTTFNALGGVYGLQENVNGGYDASVLTGLSSAANIVIKGDIVSRLGGGFAAGPIYQSSFDSEQINPNTNLPYSETIGLVASHRIESGFYANLGPNGLDPSNFQVLDPTPGGAYVLQSDRLSPAAALLGNVLNAKGPFVGSDKADFLAGLSAAAAIADPVQFDALYKAVLISGHETGDLNDATYALLNGLRYPTDLTLKAIGVAATPVTLIAAGLADTYDLGLNGIQKAFSSVGEFLGVTPDQTPPAPTVAAPDEYEMKMVTYLSAVPGSANTPLAQEFATLEVNPDTLAQQLLTADSLTWRT
ncbi:MAG TPA: hypothetical protein VJ746_14290, partial [Nitrospira sp.]|nr:hypothetical protein [Nitrospira sp.]